MPFVKHIDVYNFYLVFFRSEFLIVYFVIVYVVNFPELSFFLNFAIICIFTYALYSTGSLLCLGFLGRIIRCTIIGIKGVSACSQGGGGWGCAVKKEVWEWLQGGCRLE